MGDMMGGKSLKRTLESLQDRVGEFDRKKMMQKIEQNHYVNSLEGNVWDFESAVDVLREEIVSRIKLLNGMIMKFDIEALTEPQSPDDDE